MSWHILASGRLIADPQSRDGAKGSFVTATLVTTGDESILVSIIAFGDEAEQLLELHKGDPVAVAGRAKLTSWVGRDGIGKHGVSVVATQVAAARPRSKQNPEPDRHSGRGPRPSGSKWRPARKSAPPLPEDGVDDLYRDGLAP